MDKIPKTLYCVTSKERAQDMLKKGTNLTTFLCEDKYLANDLINTGLDEPAILEISRESYNIPDKLNIPIDIPVQKAMLDEGETIYMPGYAQYFTMTHIPADHIKEAKITQTNELGTRICSNMISIMENVKDIGEMEDVIAGMRRAANIGAMDMNWVEAQTITARRLAAEGRYDELKSEEPEDDFTKAVESLNGLESGMSQ